MIETDTLPYSAGALDTILCNLFRCFPPSFFPALRSLLTCTSWSVVSWIIQVYWWLPTHLQCFLSLPFCLPPSSLSFSLPLSLLNSPLQHSGLWTLARMVSLVPQLCVQNNSGYLLSSLILLHNILETLSRQEHHNHQVPQIGFLSLRITMLSLLKSDVLKTALSYILSLIQGKSINPLLLLHLT